jgi:hypothetical protein
LKDALFIAREWEKGNVPTSAALKASVNAHRVAREASDPTSIAIARSVGQALASAHMADHSVGAALYALKAVKSAGKSVEAERKWQIEHLPSSFTELILTTLKNKEKGIK